MANETDNKKQLSVRLSLTPRAPSAQTIYANYVVCHPAQGVIVLDAGFVEPAMLGALARAADAGEKVPPSVEGTLGARLALSYEAAARLHAQLGQALRGLRKNAGANGSTKPAT